ncbi:MAG: DUF1173 family protein [Alphaproteobacteria bacterium]
MNRISIGEKIYSLEWLRDQASAGQNVLRRAHQGRIKPLCLCGNKQVAKELYVAKRNFYYLARMPGTGKLHAPWCDFYGDADGGPGSKSQPAIIEKEDGRLDVNLWSPLTRPAKTTAPSSETKSRQIERPGVSRASITLLGLLYKLWQDGNLHVWYPVRKYARTINTIHKSLNEIAAYMDIGDDGLQDRFIVTKYQDSWPASEAKTREAIDAITKGKDSAAILIGELEDWRPSQKEQGGAGLKIRYLKDCVWMGKELAERIETSFQREKACIDDKNQKIMVICTVFQNGVTLNADDAALMRTSKEYIPVESSYELEVTRRLIEQERKFKKPVRMDENDQRPDFILLDTDPNWFMEVFGIDNDEAYTARKHEKLAAYQQQGIPCWSWEATSSKTIPAFPAPSPETLDEE